MKLKIIIYSSLIVLIAVININVVQAESFTEKLHTDSIVLKKVKNSQEEYENSLKIIKNSDLRVGYNLNPWKTFNENASYTLIENKPWEKVSLSKEEWDKINLIAYYGEKYATQNYLYFPLSIQSMIYQITDPDTKLFSLNAFNKDKEINIDPCIKTITNAIDRHYTKPNLKLDQKLYLNQVAVASDLNDVISDYKIYATENLEAHIIGPTLKLKAISAGTGKVTFIKEDTRYKNKPQLYYNQEHKNIFIPGSYEPIYVTVEFDMEIGKININNFNNEKNKIGESSFLGTKYVILYPSKNYVTTIEINEENYGTSKLLPYGTYYIQEIESGTGYKPDKTLHKITLDQKEINLDVFRQNIKADIIIELLGKINDDNYQPLKNIKFNIYDKYNELITTLTTDINGITKTTLPYGIYTVHQVSNNPNFQQIEEFEINVQNENEKIYNKLVNYKTEISENSDNQTNIKAEISENNQNQTNSKIKLPETNQNQTKYIPYLGLIIIFNKRKWLLKYL